MVHEYKLEESKFYHYYTEQHHNVLSIIIVNICDLLSMFVEKTFQRISVGINVFVVEKIRLGLQNLFNVIVFV